MIKANKKTLVGIVKVIKATIFIAVLALAAISVLTIFPINFPLKPYVVLTGSMSPTIPAGSVSFVNRNAKDFQNGDVITFIRPDDFSQNVTHRVIGEERDGNQVFYKTKGDANQDPDGWQVKREAVWGKVAFSLPFVGFAVNFARTRLGVILLIVIPLALVALDEMRVTRREVKKIREKRRNKKADKEHGETMSAESAKKAAMILLVAGFSLISTNIGSTLALFTDGVGVANNVVITGYWVPPQIDLISPLGGVTFYHSNNYPIRWSSSAYDPLSSVLVDIYYSIDGGNNYSLIAAGEVDDGIYSWVVPDGVFSTDVYLKIVGTDGHGLFSEDSSSTASEIKSPIVLNEFLPNPFGVDDAFKPNGEWVELKNNGSAPINVAGWVLYDNDISHELIVSASNSDNNFDPNDSGETIVPAGSYLTVYRNGDPDFVLDDLADSVRLYNTIAIEIDSYTYNSGKAEGFSFARIPDGTGPFVDPIPTPGRPNVVGTGNELAPSAVILPISTPLPVLPSPSLVIPVQPASPFPTVVPLVSPTPSASPSILPTVVPTPSIAPTMVPTSIPIVSPSPSPVPETPAPSVDIPIMTSQVDQNA